jgi:hypothetical protein
MLKEKCQKSSSFEDFIDLFVYYFFWNHHILDKRLEQVANQNIAQFLKIYSLFSDL